MDGGIAFSDPERSFIWSFSANLASTSGLGPGGLQIGTDTATGLNRELGYAATEEEGQLEVCRLAGRLVSIHVGFFSHTHFGA